MTVRNVQSILYTPPGGSIQSGGLSSSSATPLQDFTTLLSSEITNEDPNNPVSSTDMVTQYSEITAAAGMDQLAQMSQTYQEMQTANNILGQTVTITDPSSNASTTGVVSGLDYSQGVPQVNVNGSLYPLTNVTQVGK